MGFGPAHGRALRSRGMYPAFPLWLFNFCAISGHGCACPGVGGVLVGCFAHGRARGTTISSTHARDRHFADHDTDFDRHRWMTPSRGLSRSGTGSGVKRWLDQGQAFDQGKSGRGSATPAGPSGGMGSNPAGPCCLTSGVPPFQRPDARSRSPEQERCVERHPGHGNARAPIGPTSAGPNRVASAGSCPGRCSLPTTRPPDACGASLRAWRRWRGCAGLVQNECPPRRAWAFWRMAVLVPEVGCAPLPQPEVGSWRRTRGRVVTQSDRSRYTFGEVASL